MTPHSPKRSHLFAVAVAGALLLGGSSAHAAMPTGITFDDGYTFFKLYSQGGSRNGKPYDKGWYVDSQLRVWGKVPGRSAFKVVVKQGRRTVSTVRCEGKEFAGGMATTYCRDPKALTRKHGTVTFEVFYIDGDTDKEHLARRYKVIVRQATRMRGTVRRPMRDYPHYYISRHGEVPCGILHEVAPRNEGYIRETHRWDRGYVSLTFSLSASEEGAGLAASGRLRCTVNGKRIKAEKDQVRNRRGSRFYNVTARRFRGRNIQSSEINFRQYEAHLPLTWGKVGETRKRFSGYPSLDDHPGKWECKWTVNGKPVRTIRFTVNQDGSLAPHPEETANKLSFGPRAHLVEVIVPKGGSYIDARLVPNEVRRHGCFYGSGWKSKAGKALSRTVPRKGTPTP